MAIKRGNFGLLTTWGRSEVQHDLDPAEPNPLARANSALRLYPHLVHEGPIAGTALADDHFRTMHEQFAVPDGDRTIQDDNVIVATPADRGNSWR